MACLSMAAHGSGKRPPQPSPFGTLTAFLLPAALPPWPKQGVRCGQPPHRPTRPAAARRADPAPTGSSPVLAVDLPQPGLHGVVDLPHPLLGHPHLRADVAERHPLPAQL